MNLQLRLLKFFDCCKLAQPLTCQKSLTFGGINPQSTSSPTLGLSGNARWYFKALFCTNLQFLIKKKKLFKNAVNFIMQLFYIQLALKLTYNDVNAMNFLI